MRIIHNLGAVVGLVTVCVCLVVGACGWVGGEGGGERDRQTDIDKQTETERQRDRRLVDSSLP